MSVRNAIITPVDLLNKYAVLGDMHLLLSHLIPLYQEEAAGYDQEYEGPFDEKIEGDPLLTKREQYTRFYARCKEFKVLDNGLFENGVAEDTIALILKAQKVGADAIVAPDVLRDGVATYESSAKFASALKYSNFGANVMGVPQGNSVSDYVACYTKMVQDPNIHMIGLSILGCVDAFKEFTGTDSIHLNRVFAVNYLLSTGVFDHSKWHHLLGLGDHPGEVGYYQHVRAIRSNDSSSPIIHGMRDILYTEDGILEQGKVEAKMDFFGDYELSDHHDATVLHNIAILHKLAKGATYAAQP